MKKLNTKSKLKTIVTASTLLSICCIGASINEKTVSASPKVSTRNASTQTDFSSGSRLLSALKAPFTATSKSFGRAWQSLRDCFGLKKTNSQTENFEMHPVKTENKSNALKRGVKAPYGKKTKTKSNNNDNRNWDNEGAKPKQSATSSNNDPEIQYAELNFNGNSNTNVHPRKNPETIYTKIKTTNTSNKIPVKADIHTKPKNIPPTPPPKPKRSFTYNSNANTNKFGYTSNGEDPTGPIHQPLSSFISPSASKSKQKSVKFSDEIYTNPSTSKPLNKKPVPTPRTQKLSKIKE